MAAFIRKNMKTILFCVLGLCAGVLAGVLWRASPETAQMPAETETQPVGQVGQARILPDTEVHISNRFSLCGHSIETDEIGGELVGCTTADILSKWPQAHVKELTGERASIERELEGCCPLHYMLTDAGDGMLEVTQTEPETYRTRMVMRIRTEPEQFIQEEREQLRKGIVFDSLEQINAYLESLES